MCFRNCIFFSVYFLLLFTCKSLYAETEINHIQGVKVRKLALKDCLLPQDHPLQTRLRGLFKDSTMFASNECLSLAGFQPINREHRLLLVARHPTIKNYLIKKFKNNVSFKREIDNYLNRISAARALRKFIKLNNLKYISVPRKWLYPLPRRFSDPRTNQRSYLLIVEDMKICSGGDDPNGEIGKQYYNMNFDILRELCIVLYYFRGLDSSVRNMPFTQHGTIAFVDTEHWQDKNRGFLRLAKDYLRPDHLKYAWEIFEQLSIQDKR